MQYQLRRNVSSGLLDVAELDVRVLYCLFVPEDWL
jgi:hypothetical protein